MLDRRAPGRKLPVATAAAALAAATLAAIFRAPADGARQPFGLTESTAVIGAADHLAVPNATTAPTLDGSCDDIGYVDMVRRTLWLGTTFPDRAVEVRIARTSTQVFVCLAGLTTDSGTFAAVYVDANQSRDALAQSGDTMVSVFQPGVSPAVTTRRGNGAGDYVSFPPPSGAVAGASTVSPAGRWDAEIRLSVAFIGGDGHGIGLAAAEMWAAGQAGNDKLWPESALWNEPRTWSAALLDIRARQSVGNASGDAFVRRTYDVGDTANFGSSPVLIVGSRSMGDFYFTWRSLVAFVRPALPPASTIVATTLELWQSSGDSPNSQPVAVEACRATSPWAEPTVHWNNQPSVGTPCVRANVGRAAGVWAQWDVTTFAEAWYAGEADRGIRLRRDADESSAQHRRDYASREESTASRRPRLVVQYLPATTPTATATPTTPVPTTPAPTTRVPTTPPATTPRPTTPRPTTPPPATTRPPTIPPPTTPPPPSPTIVPTPPTPTDTPAPTVSPPRALICTAICENPNVTARWRIQLEWAHEAADEDRFQLFRSVDDSVMVPLAEGLPGSTRFVDRRVEAGRTYGYQIVALGRNGGQRSAASNTARCETR